MAIELGRTGSDLQAIVAFHSGLPSPAVEESRNIKARLLVHRRAGPRWWRPMRGMRSKAR